MKLIKTKDKFILVSDETISEGDYAYHKTFGIGKIINEFTEECFQTIKQKPEDGSITTPWKRNIPDIKKIISENPDFSLLSEEDCITIGYSKELEVILKPEHIELLQTGNVEYSNLETIYNLNQTFIKRDDKWFIKTAQSLNDKCFNEHIEKQIADFKHDLREATSNYVKQNCEGAIFGLERLKQSLQKTEWQVEVNEFNQITKIL